MSPRASKRNQVLQHPLLVRWDPFQACDCWQEMRGWRTLGCGQWGRRRSQRCEEQPWEWGAPLAVDSERGNQHGPQVSGGQCSCRGETEERKKQELEERVMSKVGGNSFGMGSN